MTKLLLDSSTHCKNLYASSGGGGGDDDDFITHDEMVSQGNCQESSEVVNEFL
jgi:hypothetical protein